MLCVGSSGQHQPKVSVIDDLVMRLNNQLAFSRKSAIPRQQVDVAGLIQPTVQNETKEGLTNNPQNKIPNCLRHC